MFFIKTNHPKTIGKKYEEEALQFFKGLGFKLIASNYQCRAGEIDLILKDNKDCIIFTEVKFRASKDFGEAQSFVNFKKQKKIIKTALFYIKENRLAGRDFRFDVAAITPDGVEHIPNAFSASGYTI